MKKITLFIVALALSTPAFAADVTLKLNDQEQKVFIALIDMGLKQGGLQSLEAMSRMVVKLQQAVKEAGGTMPAAPSAKPEAPKGQPEPVKPEDKPKE